MWLHTERLLSFRHRQDFKDFERRLHSTIRRLHSAISKASISSCTMCTSHMGVPEIDLLLCLTARKPTFSAHLRVRLKQLGCTRLSIASFKKSSRHIFNH